MTSATFLLIILPLFGVADGRLRLPVPAPPGEPRPAGRRVRHGEPARGRAPARLGAARVEASSPSASTAPSSSSTRRSRRPTPPPPSPTRRARRAFSAARTRTRASALCAPSGWRARRTSARPSRARVPVGGGHRGPLEGRAAAARHARVAPRGVARGERRAQRRRASRSHVADQASNAARVALAFARRRAR